MFYIHDIISDRGSLTFLGPATSDRLPAHPRAQCVIKRSEIVGFTLTDPTYARSVTSRITRKYALLQLHLTSGSTVALHIDVLEINYERRTDDRTTTAVNVHLLTDVLHQLRMCTG